MVEGALGLHSETVLAGKGAMGNSGYLENPESSLWMYRKDHEKPLGEQDLKIYLTSISSEEPRPTLKPGLADTGMAEAVSPPPTGWSRAALLLAPARTYLLGKRRS